MEGFGMERESASVATEQDEPQYAAIDFTTYENRWVMIVFRKLPGYVLVPNAIWRQAWGQLKQLWGISNRHCKHPAGHWMIPPSVWKLRGSYLQMIQDIEFTFRRHGYE